MSYALAFGRPWRMKRMVGCEVAGTEVGRRHGVLNPGVSCQARRLVKRLADLGFSVQLNPVAAVP